MAKLKLSAYIPSSDEYKKYFKKFRAFMSADVSEEAKEQGVFISDTGKGYFPLRTPLSLSPDIVEYGCFQGLLSWGSSYATDAGLRVAFNLIYDPKLSIVKDCVYEKRTTEVYDKEKNKVIMLTNTAPIITFGGKKCIWLNKEECENGTAKTMECWTLDLVEKAVPFDREGKHNDFAKAKKLQKQCERVLTEDCTEEELAMIVPVEMSSEDNYQKATPVIEKELEQNPSESTVKYLFEALMNKQIDEEGLRKGLKQISESLRKDPKSTIEDAKKLNEEIKRYAELFKQIMEDEKAKNQEFDQVDKAIDDLDLGGN